MTTDVDMQHVQLSQHETYEGEKPVHETEWTDLRRVPGKIPMVALLILVVEVCQNPKDTMMFSLN